MHFIAIIYHFKLFVFNTDHHRYEFKEWRCYHKWPINLRVRSKWQGFEEDCQSQWIRHETSTQCCVMAGPASETLAQPYHDIGSIFLERTAGVALWGSLMCMRACAPRRDKLLAPLLTTHEALTWLERYRKRVHRELCARTPAPGFPRSFPPG